MALSLYEIDKAFPILVRYVGLATTLVLIGFCLAGYYIQAAPGFVAATGMILYKTVQNAADDNGGEKDKHEKDLSDW